MKQNCGDSQGSSALLSDETAETLQANVRSNAEHIRLRSSNKVRVEQVVFSAATKRLGARPQESAAVLRMW